MVLVSMAFFMVLNMYPVTAVFTAVATKPSRPACMCWKYSVGVVPSRNDDVTNPRAAADRAPGGNDGSVRRDTASGGGRSLSTTCWPRLPMTWAGLEALPLDPAVTMVARPEPAMPAWACSTHREV
jgi:hypothetical protein